MTTALFNLVIHPPDTPASRVRRTAVVVRGVVQGVGFRPFVYNAARSNGLSGWVCNEAGAVRIEAQGDQAAVDAFLAVLRNSPPPQARIDMLEIADIAPEAVPSPTTFEIRASVGDSSPRPTIPADLATCRECLAEIGDPTERRHNYPFTNCTNCGPRWSIIERLPYDRPATSMAAFEMCSACRAEYENPADRRFHAQPIACPNCGPSLQLLDRHGRETAVGDAALAGAASMLLEGRIIAIKGLGGFQFLTDATNASAVARLRRRKRRPDRPFALMMQSLDEVRRYCRVSEEEARLMTSPQAPIVLLRRLSAEAVDSPSVGSSPLDGAAPGNPNLGVMLPYTPLHHLLMRSVSRPVICTSGNLAEEPMAIDAADAVRRLGAIADTLLTHDRPIVRPVDDSIVRLGVDGPQVLRRARGFAPLPIEFTVAADRAPTVLAVGGHLKNTVAVSLDAGLRRFQVALSAHVGDLDSASSVEVSRRAIDDLLEFYKIEPAAIACDMHPDYASTRLAERLASRWRVPLKRVQHHHAHVAACMAEHDLSGPVLGFSWDGAGYGPDGTVWGGEALLCDGTAYRRAASLRTFALPGGDKAAREPRRSALGLLYELFGRAASEYAAEWFAPGELDNLLLMLDRRLNSPRTSSMGRLFDAMAAICGMPRTITFEGQAAMALEFAADGTEQTAYDFSLRPSADAQSACDIVMDWELLVRGALADRAAGRPASIISARFHNTLADMAVAVANMISSNSSTQKQKRLPIVLTGGCFQNSLLTAATYRRLSAAGFSVYNHHKTPPGDGCIALGQAALALWGA